MKHTKVWDEEVIPSATDLTDLVEALDGRIPVLHKEPHLPKGEVWWLTSTLPHVMVAPDVFERFEFLVRAAVGMTICPIDEKYERFSMPTPADDADDRCEYFRREYLGTWVQQPDDTKTARYYRIKDKP